LYAVLVHVTGHFTYQKHRTKHMLSKTVDSGLEPDELPV